MTTDTTSDPAADPAPPPAAEAAPEPSIVIDATPEPAAAVAVETPPPPAAVEPEPEPEPVAEEPVAEDEEDEPVAETPAVAAVVVETPVEEEEDAAPKAEAPAPADGKPPEKPRNPNLRWYVVKVQSGREDSIKEAIERRVKIEAVEEFFGQVVVPVERETIVIQSGKRKGQKQVRKRKKYPGYVMAEVEYNDRILYLFRETSGVGDFVGGTLTRGPQPMTDREVQAMLRDSDEPKDGEKPGEKGKGTPKPSLPKKLPYGVGDKVKVRDGTFQNMEGEVKEIREPKDAADNYQISVELTVWGRPVKVQLEYWQLDPV